MGLYERRRKETKERRDKMRALRQKGWTLEAIGRRFGVSRQAVQQGIGK
jgi:lambda repressor-like predicted transcriptional regulator